MITANIAEGLKRAAPEHAGHFDARRRDFLGRLASGMARWQQALGPVRGAKVVTYHETFDYFLRRFGLVVAGVIEDRPGIPPSPSHLASLIRLMREQNVRVIAAEPFGDQKAVALIARDTGARALVVPSAVGGVKGVDDYLGLMEHLVTVLGGALR